jgi:hypothetical protein
MVVHSDCRDGGGHYKLEVYDMAKRQNKCCKIPKRGVVIRVSHSRLVGGY